MSSHIDSLIDFVRTRAAEISQADALQRPDLSALLVNAIGKAMVEIRRGANANEFKDLTVLLFIELGDQAGYTPQELSSYLQDIKSGEPDEADEL